MAKSILLRDVVLYLLGHLSTYSHMLWAIISSHGFLMGLL